MIQSPNPIVISPFLAFALNIIVSPFSQNVLFSPLLRDISFLPFHESSNKEPYSDSVGPDIVPLPKKSPTYRLQPVTVWWVSCWAGFQYKYLKLLIANVYGSFYFSVYISTSNGILYEECFGSNKYLWG